ncbi:peptidase M23B [Calothrix sp. NIES-4071]|nr:peptidase M23B [Calothrix sp. NIES-4071]BAZ62077.1 peptidase M23B [Calothrix sp. NIES-4105]
MKSPRTNVPYTIVKKIPNFKPIICYVFNISAVLLAFTSITLAQSSSNCPRPALSRFLRHTVSNGETLERIAQAYNLTPKSILTMNPGLQNRQIQQGNQILIPPYDGIIVEVPRSMTWRDIAKQYKIRADVLFEVNGCQSTPRLVFVPQSRRPLNQTDNINSINNNSTTQPAPVLTGYPLTQAATIALSYGWQNNPKNGEVFFHSGIDLLAPVGTSVQATKDGTVVFAGTQGSYGNLVIINHAQGLQTRYAQLETIKVTKGQKVLLGDILGTVGTTGQPTSPQPHLHFEVRTSSDLGWKALNPQDYLK